MPKPNRTPAQVFPPGDFLREELEARDWTQADLARVLGRPVQTISAIINGKKEITPETALGLSAAFGTSALYWLNLEMAYRLHRAEPADPAIFERARKFEEIKKRLLDVWA